MLKQTEPHNKVIRLVTGEEMIARVESTTMVTTTVYKPHHLAAHEGGMVMIPVSFMGKEDSPVVINNSAIVYTTDPTPELENAFESKISGIQLLEKPQIII